MRHIWSLYGLLAMFMALTNGAPRGDVAVLITLNIGDNNGNKYGTGSSNCTDGNGNGNDYDGGNDGYEGIDNIEEQQLPALAEVDKPEGPSPGIPQGPSLTQDAQPPLGPSPSQGRPLPQGLATESWPPAGPTHEVPSQPRGQPIAQGPVSQQGPVPAAPDSPAADVTAVN